MNNMSPEQLTWLLIIGGATFVAVIIVLGTLIGVAFGVRVGIRVLNGIEARISSEFEAQVLTFIRLDDLPEFKRGAFIETWRSDPGDGRTVQIHASLRTHEILLAEDGSRSIRRKDHQAMH